MEKKSSFLKRFGLGMLLDITLFVLAMSLLIIFGLASLGFAYILAIGILLVAGFSFYIYRKRRPSARNPV